MSDIQTVVGLGEILWDIFPDASRFGGAPSNFACSAAKLGRSHTHTLVASGIGRDELGSRAVQELTRNGVAITAVQKRDTPTGTVTVRLDREGQASYLFAENCAWDNLCWTEVFESVAREADVVCFGSLGQRSPKSRETIRRFVNSTPESSHRIFDVNLRPPFHTDEVIQSSLSIASVLKLNEDELPQLAALVGLSGGERDLMQALARKYELECVALTRGANGAAIWRAGDFTEIEGAQVNVIDTVGAGDAFTAVLALGLLDDLTLGEILNRATAAAGFVCASHGATPDFPDELRWSQNK